MHLPVHICALTRLLVQLLQVAGLRNTSGKLRATSSSALHLIRPQLEHTPVCDKKSDLLQPELPAITKAAEVTDLKHVQRYDQTP